MIILLLSAVFSQGFNTLQINIEKHATKTKVLSLELEDSIQFSEHFFPAKIDFLSDKIHSEVLLIEQISSSY